MRGTRPTVRRETGRGSSPLVWLPAVALVSVAVLTMLDQREVPPLDLRVYSGGVRALVHGQSVYEQTYTAVQLAFTYPPFALLAFLPLAVMGEWLQAGVVELASIGCVAVLLHLALGRTRIDAVVATVLFLAAMTAEPVWMTLSFGQVNLLLAALIAADLAPGQERRWRGVGLGLAAGIKLTPLVFLAWLALTRQWRAAGVAVGTFLATVVVSFVAVPGHARTFWVDGLAATLGGRSNPVGDAMNRSMPKAYVGNQSAMGFFSRVLGPDTDAATLAWLLLGGLVSVAIVGIGAWLTLRGERTLGFFVASLAMVVASPIAWTHHWVWAVPLAVALWESAPRVAPMLHLAADHLRALAALVAVVMVADAHWWAPYNEGREQHWTLMQSVVGNDYLVLFCVVLGVLGTGVVRSRLAGRAAQRAEAERPPASPSSAGTSSASRIR